MHPAPRYRVTIQRFVACLGVLACLGFSARALPAQAADPSARITDLLWRQQGEATSVTALVTYPVDVWFGGSRSFSAMLDFGRPIARVTYDPKCRFPDREPADNVWPRGSAAPCPRRE